MARTLTPDTQAKADQEAGTEPLVVIEIEWPSGTELYADKALQFGGGIDAKAAILDFASVSSQGKEDETGEVSSASVTLDDTDGTLKTLLNTDVLEGTPCTVYHHYQGLLKSDALIILKGTIIGAAAWDEGERELSFTIESLTSDNEIGYAPEAGDLTQLHPDAEGVMWPLCFGTVLKVPAVRVRKRDVGRLKDILTSNDTSVEIEGGSDFTQGTPLQIDLSRVRCSGSFTNDTFNMTSVNDAWHTSIAIKNRQPGDDFVNAAVVWLDDSGTYPNIEGLFCWVDHSIEGDMINRCIKQEGNKCFFEKPWRPNLTDKEIVLAQFDTIEETAGFPRVSWPDYYIIESFQYKYVGSIRTDRIAYIFSSYVVSRTGWAVLRDEIVFAVNTENDLYIVNGIESTEVLDVFGYREHDDETIFAAIPSSYYTKRLAHNLAGQVVTSFEFPVALESFAREGWKGDIYVSLRSTIGPNTSDIIKWLIETYTDLTTDPASFASVATDLTNFPSNFVLFDQDEVLSICEDIAYQARCALYVRGGTVYIKYLSETPTADYTITEAEAEFKSLQLSFTDHEDIVTDIKAKYRTDYSGKQDANGVVLGEKELVYKNNIDIYGKEEDERNYFIYNIGSLVDLSLNFWGYRRSNSWRMAHVSTFLNALSLENFDTLAYNIGVVSGNTIKSLVERVVHDTGRPSITLDSVLASKAGDVDGGNEPVEDPNYWIGDPANPVFPVPAAPADVGAGLSEVDYTVERDPAEDDDNDSEVPEQQVLTITPVIFPFKVIRGVNFEFGLELRDQNGNRVSRNINVNLVLQGGDSSDALAFNTVQLQNGYAFTNLQNITGGTAKTSARMIAVSANDTRIFNGFFAFEIVNASVNIEWEDAPNEDIGVVRDETFRIEISGPPPAATVNISSAIQGGSGDTLEDGGGPITSIVMPGSGNFIATDWKYTGGSGDGSTADITAGYDPGGGEEFETVTRFPINAQPEEPDETLSVNVRNIGGTEIPANGHAMEVVNVDENGIRNVVVPTGDSVQPGLILFTGKDAITASGGEGIGYSAFDAVIQAAYTGSTPNNSDTLITKTGQTTLEVGTAPGFIVQGAIGGARALVRPFRGIAVTPIGAGAFALSFVGHIWENVSGTWTQRTATPLIAIGADQSIVRLDTATLVYLRRAAPGLGNGQSSISLDSGATWGALTNHIGNANPLSPDDAVIQGNTIYAFTGTTKTKIIKSTDGVNWSLAFDIVTGTPSIPGIVTKSGENMFITNTGRIIATIIQTNLTNGVEVAILYSDDGISWTYLAIKPFFFNVGGIQNLSAVNKDNNDIYVMHTISVGTTEIHKSTTDGASFGSLGTLVVAQPSMFSERSQISHSIWFARGTGDTIKASVDFGFNWTDIGGGPFVKDIRDFSNVLHTSRGQKIVTGTTLASWALPVPPSFPTDQTFYRLFIESLT